jgi:hypothetical protein
MLNSLKRGEKRTHVQWHHAFLVEIVLILPRNWAHLKNVTAQFSLREWNILRLRSGVGTWAVVEAWHLHNVKVEMLYTLYKLTYTDTLGLF